MNSARTTTEIRPCRLCGRMIELVPTGLKNADGSPNTMALDQEARVYDVNGHGHTREIAAYVAHKYVCVAFQQQKGAAA